MKIHWRFWQRDPPGHLLQTDDVLRAEFAHLLQDESWMYSHAGTFRNRLKAMGSDAQHPAPSALCLSGGGIRSATFSLGVLQWMASHGKLDEYHYLSTVSGGGYVGGWLINSLREAREQAGGARGWLARMAHGFGAARPAPGVPPDPVAQLRAFSNYLSPTGGLSGDTFSLAAIFVRNLLLNTLVWLPLLAGAVALPRFYIALLGAAPDTQPFFPLVLWLSLICIVVGITSVAADLPAVGQGDVPPTPEEKRKRRSSFRWLGFSPVVLAAVLLSILGAWAVELRGLHWSCFAGAGAVAHVIGAALGGSVRASRGLSRGRPTTGSALVVVAVGFAGGALLYLVLSNLSPDDPAVSLSAQERLAYATFAVPAMTGAFWVAMTLYAGLMSRPTSEGDREWWARATGQWLRFSLIWMAAFGAVVWLPMPVLDQVGALGNTAVRVGIGSGVLGVVTSLIGYWSKNGNDIRRTALNVVRALRLKLLEVMAGLVVLTILLAISLGWNAALDRCHHWDWTAIICKKDISAETNFLREQAALLDESEQAGKGGAQRSVLDAETLGVDPQGLQVGGSTAARTYRHVLLAGEPWVIFIAASMLFLFSGAFAWAMGVNNFSLHGMYRNRLVRAYLGTGRSKRNAHWFTDFDASDDKKLEVFMSPLMTALKEPRLYPVINIALNMVRPSPERLDWQQRKAAPFVATPLACGAANVGYRPSRTYTEGATLGRAMTISGAAASPNMGYHSSPLVGFVMTLFNVRLGWWSPNPARRFWDRRQPLIGIRIAIAEATGSTGEKDDFVYLSDGGHFDNLGIYEMVRRRCRRIVVVDGTCDGGYGWGDLLETVRKIRVDLGTEIELPAVLPGPDRKTQFQRCLVAPIRYAARDGGDAAHDGELTVLKPMLIRGRDAPELVAYADASAPRGSGPDDPRRFPHQTTADPFFDEQQFESYRLLGFQTAQEVLGKRRCDERPSTAAAAAFAAAGGSSGLLPTAAGVAAGGGLGQLVERVGTTAALATALTIGGTLGVAGSVALGPGEVSLSAADRALLRDGLSVRMEAADRAALDHGIKVSADASAFDAPAGALTAAAQAISGAAARLGPGSAGPLTDSTILALVGVLRGVDFQVRELTVRIGEIGRNRPPGETAELTAAMLKLQQTLLALEQKLPTDPDLASAIRDLNRSILEIAPRRNVRGQEGAR